MADHGGNGETPAGARRSRLTDYADMARPEAPPEAVARGSAAEGESSSHGSPPPEAVAPDEAASLIGAKRREFAALVGEFRRTAVLVPLDEDEIPLTGDQGGVRWIYAFTDEAALARFAIARGEQRREWTFRQVLGARLLDVAVPAVGVPCGIAVDVGSEDGVLLPPAVGIVPDFAAVDAGEDGEERR
ncbi:SseB family protein [Streptomyces sp. NPDC052309]|uniref:SseB family protein n=1 Tax=Streptomyces sp. NPDC052309 TaxID=3155421 RepID=UPI003449B111